MRSITKLFLASCLAGATIAGSTANAAVLPQYQDPGGNYDYQDYSPDQLDNLLAPVALYPDPLLAQVLVAATFPDQIQDAADWVRHYGPADPRLDDQSWDVSVRAVAHYPAVLNMMNDKLDWTTAVGQAYVYQSTDAMSSIQHLRNLARSEGNLVSTPQQQIIDDGGYIQIVPAQPQYIYVPTYDPGVIYSRRVYNGSSFGGFFSFGSGFSIGAWLNYDLDWGSRRVVYDGWSGGGWRQRSRPYVHVNNIYVNNRYQNVVVNRTVINRTVNYQNVNKFNSVHNNVRFDNRGPGNRGNNNGNNGRPGGPPNSNSNNSDANRGQRTVQPPPQQPQRPDGGFNRARLGQPVPSQPAPQVPAQNNPRPGNQPGIDDNRNERGGARGENPRRQNTIPERNVRGRDNGNPGPQNQSAPARVEPARPIPPAATPPPVAPQPVQQQRAEQQQQQQRRAAPPQPQQQRPAQGNGGPPSGGQPRGQQDHNGGGNGDGHGNGRDNKGDNGRGHQ